MSAPDTRPETRAEPSPDAIICDLVAAILGDDVEAWPEGDLYANAAVAEKVARTQPDAVEALEARLREAAVAHFGEVAESVDVEIAGFVRIAGTPDQASAIYEAEATFEPPDDYVVTFSFHSRALTTDEGGA